MDSLGIKASMPYAMNQYIKAIKESRKGKSYKSVDEMLKEFDTRRQEEKKRNPLWYYGSIAYYRIQGYLKEIPLMIKTFFQRGKRGWANSDTWNFDYYLAKVISEGVLHLYKCQHGHPSDLTEEKWQGILLEIVYTFKTAQKIIDREWLYTPLKEFNWNKYKKMKKLAEKFNKKHNDNHRVMTKIEIARFERGFDLFRKYSFNLWD
jgi:hypothetical protein